MRRLLVVCLAPLAVLGLSVAVVPSAMGRFTQASVDPVTSVVSAQGLHTATVGARQRTIVNRCDRIVARPRSIDWCANTSDRFLDVLWKTWGLSRARGRAIFRINTCEPSCADGNLIYRQARVRLSEVRWVNGHPRFSRLSWLVLRSGDRGHIALPTVVQRAVLARTQVVHDCTDYRVAPRHNIVITCADGGVFLDDLHWRYWHKYDARGHGYLVVNDCDPSCARGRYHRYPARFRLTHARTDHRHFVFHHVSTRFTGTRPANVRSLREMQLPGYTI